MCSLLESNRTKARHNSLVVDTLVVELIGILLCAKFRELTASGCRDREPRFRIGESLDVPQLGEVVADTVSEVGLGP